MPIESGGALDSVEIILVKAPKPFYSQLSLWDFAIIGSFITLGLYFLKKKLSKAYDTNELIFIKNEVTKE